MDWDINATALASRIRSLSATVRLGLLSSSLTALACTLGCGPAWSPEARLCPAGVYKEFILFDAQVAEHRDAELLIAFRTVESFSDPYKFRLPRNLRITAERVAPDVKVRVHEPAWAKGRWALYVSVIGVRGADVSKPVFVLRICQDGVVRQSIPISVVEHPELSIKSDQSRVRVR